MENPKRFNLDKLFSNEENIIITLLSDLDSVEVSDQRECTPLILAARKSLVHVVKHLITRNAKVNSQNNMGDTALSIYLSLINMFFISRSS